MEREKTEKKKKNTHNKEQNKNSSKFQSIRNDMFTEKIKRK